MERTRWLCQPNHLLCQIHYRGVLQHGSLLGPVAFWEEDLRRDNKKINNLDQGGVSHWFSLIYGLSDQIRFISLVGSKDLYKRQVCRGSTIAEWILATAGITSLLVKLISVTALGG